MLFRGQGRGTLQPLAVATTALIVASLFVMGGSEVPPTTRQAGVSSKDAGAVVVKEINLANQIIANISKSFILGGFAGSLFQGRPSLITTNPTPLDTVLHVSHPACFGKEAALLGSFCVAPTTEEEDKDPEHKLPRITFSVQRDESAGAGPLTIFLFDDEAHSWPSFWSLNMANRSCDDIRQKAKAAISNAGNGLPAYKNIMGKMPHMWYVVAVDCETRQCPKIQTANISFFHPNSDGSHDRCSGMPSAALALKESLMEGIEALSVNNVLHVAGLTPFGVFLLYLEFIIMLLFSVLFLIWGIRAESAKRFLYFNTFFCTSITCMAYLAMATGNGIFVLRRFSTEDGKGHWHFTLPSLDVRNAALSEEYASQQTYPIFFAHHLMQLFASPLLLLDLFLITGVGVSTRAFMLFCNTMMVLCFLSGAFITTPSRWGFWVFGLCFSLGVLIPMVGVLPTAAARKGRSSRRLYGRLMCVTLVSGVLYPWAWVLIDGSHALPGDMAAFLYGILDLVAQCVFGVVLLRKVPALADWGDDLQEEESRKQVAMTRQAASSNAEDYEDEEEAGPDHP